MAVLALVSALSAYGGYVAHKEGLIVALHNRIVGHTPPCCREEVSSLLPVSNDGDHDAFVDAVRLFVNSSSVRSSSLTSHGASAYDTGGVIRSLISAHKGSGEPPELLCSSRANAMSGILETFGIKSRQVHIFSYDDGSHTFIEVQNPHTGSWVIHDPDYNLIWMTQHNNHRIGLSDLITESTDDVMPCRVPGECSWKLAGNLRVFLGAGVYFNFDGSPHALVNRNRFDPAKPLSFSTPPRTLERYISDLWEADFGAPVISVVSGKI